MFLLLCIVLFFLPVDEPTHDFGSFSKAAVNKGLNIFSFLWSFLDNILRKTAPLKPWIKKKTKDVKMGGIVRPLRLEDSVHGVGLRTGIHSVTPQQKLKGETFA